MTMKQREPKMKLLAVVQTQPKHVFLTSQFFTIMGLKTSLRCAVMGICKNDLLCKMSNITIY